MTFARRSPANLAAVDKAFDEAEANARHLGKEVAEHITREFKVGNIDRHGVNAWVELALEQAAGNAAGVPKAMLKSILRTLHQSIAAELAAAGIRISELPA